MSPIDLLGAPGNDRLIGGERRERLFGLEGDDTLDGGRLDDTLTGGPGADVFVLPVAESDGGEQTDLVTDFTPGEDVIDLSATGIASAGSLGFALTALDGRAAIATRFNGVAQRTVFEGLAPGSFDAADFRFATDPAPRVLVGGEGADDLYGGLGPDRIDGRAGFDRLIGDAGDDTLDGGSGDDTLDGGAGDDSLLGGDGFDLLSGGAGDDTLSGGPLSDTLRGGPGRDVFVLAPLAPLGGDQTDLIEDFAPGEDRIDVRGVGVAGWETLRALLIGDADATLRTVAEGVRQTTILQGVARSVLKPTDILFDSGAVSRRLAGTSGSDDLFGGRRGDTLSGGAGSDRLFGDAGADSLDGGSGEDQLFGGGGDDTLAGGDGFDRLFGGAGADRLRGGRGDDTLTGGAGADLFEMAPVSSLGGDQTDRVTDFRRGEDRVDARPAGVGGWQSLAELLRPWDGATAIETRWSGVRQTLVLLDVRFGALSAADVVFGSVAAARSRTGSSGGDDLFGGAAGDLLRGGLGADRLFGDRGDDRLSGGSGEDALFGGSGDDRLWGGDGADRLEGGPGRDVLVGGTSADTLSGGLGRDLADYGASDFGVRVNLSRGVGAGGDAAGDRLSGVEDVAGSAFADRLTGDGGPNLLRGGAGPDTLVGGAGDDTLEGGAGADRLVGGGGADRFVFRRAADSAPAAPDVVAGFEGAGRPGGDRIDLSAIDADPARVGDQAFRFGAGDGPARLRLRDDGRDTIVEGDRDGDGRADLVIVIADGAGTRAADYVAADFIL